jgi:hypothetical protein
MQNIFGIVRTSGNLLDNSTIIEIDEDMFWIHETHSAINEEFKFWTVQNRRCNLNVRGVRLHKASTNVTNFWLS